MELIDIVVAEIERRRDAALTRQRNLEAIGQVDVLNEMVASELNRIIAFINNLEVEEVDFDKEYQKWLREEWFNPKKIRTMSQYCYDMANHFFNLGLHVKIKSEEKIADYISQEEVRQILIEKLIKHAFTNNEANKILDVLSRND